MVLISSSLLIGCGGKEEASCPGGFISIGGGYCREVRCAQWTFNNQILSDLSDSQKKTFFDAGYECGITKVPVFSGQPIPASR